MRAITAMIAAVVGIVPAVFGGLFLLDPLFARKSTSDDDAPSDGFLPLAVGPEAVPDDGTPQAFTILADRVDAWNFYPQEPVGSIWIRKTDTGKLIAFNSICPHLGCFVDYRSTQRDFFCPCHLSTFDLDGGRQNRIPPRDMDELELKVTDGQIWVKYQNFRGAVPEKTPV